MSAANCPRTKQQGFAIVAALLLLVIAAALAALSVRAGIISDSAQDIRVLSARMEAAATSGLEYGSIYYAGVGGCAVPAPQGLTVRLTCVDVGNGTRCLTSTAQINTYGQPDFVQRTRYRVVVSALPFSWDTPGPC